MSLLPLEYRTSTDHASAEASLGQKLADFAVLSWWCPTVSVIGFKFGSGATIRFGMLVMAAGVMTCIVATALSRRALVASVVGLVVNGAASAFFYWLLH